jgi:Na+/H+-translocating membrane pyrophosphatase
MSFTVSLDNFSALLVAAASCGVLALFVAFIFRLRVGLFGTGTEEMQAIAAKIRAGAMAFLWRESLLIYVFMAFRASISTGVSLIVVFIKSFYKYRKAVLFS